MALSLYIFIVVSAWALKELLYDDLAASLCTKWYSGQWGLGVEGSCRVFLCAKRRAASRGVVEKSGAYRRATWAWPNEGPNIHPIYGVVYGSGTFLDQVQPLRGPRCRDHQAGTLRGWREESVPLEAEVPWRAKPYKHGGLAGSVCWNLGYVGAGGA